MFRTVYSRQPKTAPSLPMWIDRGDGGIMMACFAFIAVSALTAYLVVVINNTQPNPYMDEIFHVDQALQYCKGNLSYWNEKITTLPGLYMSSVSILTCLHKLFQQEPPCTVFFLRLTNIIPLLVIYHTILDLQKSLLYRCQLPSYPFIWFSSLTLTLMPVQYFFSFLYYTDPMSTALVLMMFKMHLREHHYSASIVGLLACMARQTNIIWLGLCFLDLLLHIIEKQQASAKWRGELARSFQCLSQIETMFFCILENMKRGFSMKIIGDLMKRGLGYVFVLILFVVFLVWNKGIVVGDRNAHQAVIHLPQLLYFTLFSLCFGFPYFIPMVLPFLRAVNRNKLYSIDWIFTMMIGIYLFTMSHPYLLADNRHYVFYIWQRLYQRHFLVPYLLIPVYMFSGYSMIKLLIHNGSMFTTVYCFCLLGCLVPQKLLEFRYFIIPYLLFRLHIKTELWQVCIEFAFYVMINFITINLFLFKPFFWPNSTELQRFIW